MRLATEPAAQHDVDCSVAAAEARMEIIAKAKPFIEADAITVNANTTVESEACSGIDMGATHSRSTSSDP